MLLGSVRIVSDDRGALKSRTSRTHPKKCLGALGFGATRICFGRARDQARPLCEEAAMNRINLRIVICTLSICLVTLALPITGAAGQQSGTGGNSFVSQPVNRGEKIKMEGLVTGRQGDIVTVRTADATSVQVALTDYTKVVTPRGLFRKKHMPVSDLLPGLWIKVKGVGDSPGHILAESVTFSTDDLRTANAIQAGLTPLDARVQSNQRQIQANTQNIQANQQQIQTHEQQIQSNQQQGQANQQQIGETNQRISELADYSVKYTAAVN